MRVPDIINDYATIDLTTIYEGDMNCYVDIFYDYFDIKNFGITKEKYRDFIELVKSNYYENSYHNFNHALDVVINLIYLLEISTLAFTKLEKFALFLAMLCHDVGHFGKTGRFVKLFLSDFVEQYKLNSPLEEYHLEITLECLEKIDILSNLPDNDIKKIIKIIELCIFATDPETTKNFIDNEHNNFKLIVKCADIGSSTKIFNVHKKWVELLIEEFYVQGDEMKKIQLNVSDLFDRDKIDKINDNQVWYFDNYAIPLYDRLEPYLNDKLIITNLYNNRKQWNENK